MAGKFFKDGDEVEGPESAFESKEEKHGVRTEQTMVKEKNVETEYVP